MLPARADIQWVRAVLVWLETAYDDGDFRYGF
jgi:hypothetical protein